MKPYYSDDHCTIYHGDCREILPAIEKVDTVIADPPYGINTKSDWLGKLSPWADLCNASLWYEMWLKACRDRLRPTGCLWSFLNWRSQVTFQKASCDMQWPIESMLIWDKDWIGPGGSIGLRPSYEQVALFAGEKFALKDRGLRDIRTQRWSSQKPNGHPAEKPIGLVRWLIDISGGDVILDPFMGSGTTLRAAKDSGRRSIGIELDKRYCDRVISRMGQEVFDFDAAS